MGVREWVTQTFSSEFLFQKKSKTWMTKLQLTASLPPNVSMFGEFCLMSFFYSRAGVICRESTCQQKMMASEVFNLAKSTGRL